jgi:prepilin-type processing-associated H-X9-DG protein
MIENFVIDADLSTKEPRITEWQPTSATRDIHRADGYKKTCIELNKIGVDTRLVMIPFYLATGLQTISNTVTGDWILAQRKNRVKRLVIKKVTCTDGGGGNIWYVDGSNDNGTTWVNIKTLNNTTGTGTISVTFDDEYKYYRFRLVKATSLSFTGYIYLIETSFDDLIVYQSLKKTFTALSRKEGDNFDLKSVIWAKEFKDEIETLNYSYDSNESGTIDDDEGIRKKSNGIRIRL